MGKVGRSWQTAKPAGVLFYSHLWARRFWLHLTVELHVWLPDPICHAKPFHEGSIKIRFILHIYPANVKDPFVLPPCRRHVHSGSGGLNAACKMCCAGTCAGQLTLLLTWSDDMVWSLLPEPGPPLPPPGQAPLGSKPSEWWAKYCKLLSHHAGQRSHSFAYMYVSLWQPWLLHRFSDVSFSKA